MFDFKPYKDIFGLDISDLVLRAVQLKRKGEKIILSSLNEQLVPAGYITEGEIINPKRVIEIIQHLVKTVRGEKIKSPYVVAAIPERKTFIKLIQMPKIDSSRIAEAVRWEATQHIPMSMDEIYLDWQIMPKGMTANNQLNVLIAAAPRTLIDSYTQVLEMAGLVPIALELESVAIARAIIKEGKESPDYSEMIIDLGGSRTNLIVYDLKTVQFTSSIPFSGTELSQTIAKKMNFKFNDAEKAKVICGLDPKRGRGIIRKILMPQIEELEMKIKDVTTFYKDHFSYGRDCKKIILSGGGAQLKNLDLELNKMLNLPLEKADPLVNIQLEPRVRFLTKEKTPSFTTAIGLALRGIYQND